jgi:pantetheine-phosphate adenylyltransferase
MKIIRSVFEELDIVDGFIQNLQASLIALYPGSFDPLTYGHLDIIERATHLFEKVVVSVVRNPRKIPLFTTEERMEHIRKAVAHLNNVEVHFFDGLTYQYAHSQGAKFLIRGLRAVSDFELELQMAQTNRTLDQELETIFLATATEYSFLSSSVVREIAQFGGPVDHLVPAHIAQALAHKFSLKAVAEEEQ